MIYAFGYMIYDILYIIYDMSVYIYINPTPQFYLVESVVSTGLCGCIPQLGSAESQAATCLQEQWMFTDGAPQAGLGFRV